MMMKLLPPTSHLPSHSLFVARDGAYFWVSGGDRVSLSNTGALRRIFRALLQSHREAPRAALTVAELFDAGWFGERAKPEIMAGRVYTAISKLRRMGLADLLGKMAGGYGLDPRCCVIEECSVTRLRATG